MKKKIEYVDIENAKNIFGIEEKASINKIRSIYRKLVKSDHPDKFPELEKEKYEEKIKNINNAYNLLISYCENYNIIFSLEDFLENQPESRFNDFMSDWF